VATLSSLNKTSAPPPIRDTNDFLYSWKEMAVFLKCGVRTVQRWEKSEDLPVHRHKHWKRGTVYALKSEIEEWLRSRDLREKGKIGPTNGLFLADNGTRLMVDNNLLYTLCQQARERAARARQHFSQLRPRSEGRD
jgi:hypothetical protein